MFFQGEPSIPTEKVRFFGNAVCDLDFCTHELEDVLCVI